MSEGRTEETEHAETKSGEAPDISILRVNSPSTPRHATTLLQGFQQRGNIYFAANVTQRVHSQGCWKNTHVLGFICISI